MSILEQIQNEEQLAEQAVTDAQKRAREFIAARSEAANAEAADIRQSAQLNAERIARDAETSARVQYRSMIAEGARADERDSRSYAQNLDKTVDRILDLAGFRNE